MSDQPAKKVSAPVNKKKLILIGAAVVLVILNVMWTVLQNKFTPRVDALREEFTKIEARLAKLEKDALPDVEAIRSELNALKLMSEAYEDRSSQLLKAEEAQLASLESQLATQKERVESLKKLGAAEAEGNGK